MPRKPSPSSSRQPFGRRACEACRASKTKCDRRPCCARCQEKHLDCCYDYNSESTAPKASLREEIQRRKERLEEANTILDALRDKAATDPVRGRPNDAILEIIRGLSRGDTRESIVKRLHSIDANDMALLPSPPHAPATPCSNTQSMPTPLSMDVDSPAPSLSGRRASNIGRPQLFSSESTACSDSSTTRSSQGSDSYMTQSSQRSTSSTTQSSQGSDSYMTQSSQGSDSSFISPLDTISLSTSPSPTHLFSAMGVGEPQHKRPSATYHHLPRDLGWTSLNLSKQQVKDLITPVLDWDGVPLCLVRKELFMRDFESGARQYCSPALVSALVALALVVTPPEQQQQQQQQQQQHIPDGDYVPNLASLDSDCIARESRSQVQGGGTMLYTLPDSQAIGVLALRETSLDQNLGAATQLVDEFTVAMGNLCFREHETAADGNEHAQVRAMTYRGAVTLRRIVQLTGVTASYHAVVEAHRAPFLEMSKRDSNLAELADTFSSHVPGAIHPQKLHRYYPHYLISGLFQLAGCLQKLQVQECISTPDPSIRVQLYFKCLEWYNGFFAVQSWHRDNSKTDDHHGHHDYHEPIGDEDKTQDLNFEVFTHMFYHFCILKTLSPLALDTNSRVGEMLTSDICRSAAESVRALTFPTTAGSDLHEWPRQRPGQLTSKFVSAADSFLASLPLTDGASAS